MLNVKRKASEEIPDSFQHIWLYEKKYSYFWRILQVYNIRRQKGWNITFLFSSSPYFIIPTCLLHINTKNVNIKLKNLNKIQKTKIQNLNKKMNKIHIRLTEATVMYCTVVVGWCCQQRCDPFSCSTNSIYWRSPLIYQRYLTENNCWHPQWIQTHRSLTLSIPIQMRSYS